MHRDGQTFLTWRYPQIGGGWTCRVYASHAPITGATALADSIRLAVVRDSSWYDWRLSLVADSVIAYSIDSTAAPLDATQGLFVATAIADRALYYAVTAQLGAEPEDSTITAGANALLAPVAELVGLPRPVYQRKYTWGGITGEFYTLWTSDRSTPVFPAMSNVPGTPFDCAIVRGGTAPNNALKLSMHHGGGNLLYGLAGSGQPGEWVLALDDPLPMGWNTYWFGYHEDFDVYTGTSPVPTTGTVHDYTYQRLLYTTLWARRTFPIDTTQVYAYGASMGAIGSMMLAFRRPDLVAGVLGVVGKFDFSFLADPNPLASFNPGGGLRATADRFWGTVADNLPCSDGRRVYESLNFTHLASEWRARGLPPIIALNGKNDAPLGWAEVIPFYQSMQANLLGGYFFWDMRDHPGSIYSAWVPQADARYLFRFRTNLSYPALSNCGSDMDPGDGNAASGDSVGVINAFVEWDTSLVDLPARWEVGLHTRDLARLSAPPMPGPDSTTVDVTPRRLQQFVVTVGASYRYTVTREADGAVLQTGVVSADLDGLVTVPGVKVLRGGTRLALEPDVAARSRGARR